jgi:hypothetical protein
MKLFQHISQIHDLPNYEKHLKAVFPKAPGQVFHFFEKYKFETKEGPLLLLGEVDSSVMTPVKAAGKSGSYATGKCSLNDDGQLVFDVKSGKVALKPLAKLAKTAGFKKEVILGGQEEDIPPAPPAPPVKQTSPSGEKGAPPKRNVGVAPKAPAQETPPSGEVSEEARKLQERIKAFRPTFDKALAEAKAKDPQWAASLEANFAQLYQEARDKKTEKALGTLQFLARLAKSKEASRAEVKHKIELENPETARQYAEYQKDREDAGLETDEEELAGQGVGVTEDGMAMYALAVKPDEWKVGVVDKAAELRGLLRGEDLDLDAIRERTAALEMFYQRVSNHAHENSDERPARALGPVRKIHRELAAEVDKLEAMSRKLKDPKEIAQELGSLSPLVAAYAKGPAGAPSKEEREKFAAEAAKRQQARVEEIEKLKKKIEEYDKQVKEWGMKERGAIAPSLLEEARVKRLQAMDSMIALGHARSAKEQSLKDGSAEAQARRAMEAGERVLVDIGPMEDGLTDALHSVKNAQFAAARDQLGEVLAYMSRNPSQGEEEAVTKLLQTTMDLRGDVSLYALRDGASVQKAAAQAEQLWKAANVFLREMEKWG